MRIPILTGSISVLVADEPPLFPAEALMSGCFNEAIISGDDAAESIFCGFTIAAKYSIKPEIPGFKP